MDYIGKWYNEVHDLYTMLVRNDCVANIWSRVGSFFIGYAHSNKQLEITGISIMEDPIAYIDRSIELQKCIKKEEENINLYCKKKKLDYWPNKKYDHLNEKYLQTRKLLLIIMQIRHRVWYKSKFLIVLASNICPVLLQFLYAVIQEKLSGDKIIELILVGFLYVVFQTIALLWGEL